jgi:glucose uptake protein GlcU
MNIEVGYFFALATILLFGSWAVPTKTLKIHPLVLAFWLTVGHFLLSLILYIFNPQGITFEQSAMPFVAGVLWALGIAAGYVGIRELGITRAIGTWIPIVILTSALWGFLFFGEAATLGTQRLIVSLCAIGLLVLAALLIVLSSKEDKKTLGNVKLGLIAAIVLGITHGSFFVPLRASDAGTFVSFLPLTAGMVVATFVLLIINKHRIVHDVKSTFRMISGGFLLGGGNYTAIFTTIYLGVAQGYPLTQLAIIVNTLWGIFFFKEASTGKGKMLILAGVICALFGAIVLNQARIR